MALPEVGGRGRKMAFPEVGRKNEMAPKAGIAPSALVHLSVFGHGACLPPPPSSGEFACLPPPPSSGEFACLPPPPTAGEGWGGGAAHSVLKIAEARSLNQPQMR